ncbi:FAD-dependent oxidoreductase [Granulosicoccus sp. 3-233]|uniref:FAD-dependent oxidoreductase n=1 Tax=Granulosicoccus sp. 3-233 TaxID=3417969 RepID=UPI003D34E37D
MSGHDAMADIVIVGAGLVGLPLAQVLAAQGWQVVLLDAQGPAAASPVPADTSLRHLQQRCTAVSLGTQRWFARHGLWSVLADDAAPIRQVVVTHRGYFGTTRLQAEEMGVEALGHVLNNQHLVDSLQPLMAESTVDHRRAARVVAVRQQEESVEVRLDGGETLSARLLIAADGVSSVVRESVGITTRQVDYQQAAVLSMLQLVDGHEDVAHERFTDSGPLALLPRTGPYMNVVDCIDSGQQAEMSSLDDAEYLARLQDRFGYRLGRFAAVGPRLVLPLLRIEATAQSAPRALLLGNAMRLLHPVGGQGFNLAMRDVECLVQLLSQQRDADPGDARLLSAFVAARQADQQQVVRFTDTLARSFRGRASLPAHLRSAALLGLDTLTPLRRRFAGRTMGLSS